MSDPAASITSNERPERTVRGTLRRLQTGRLADAAMAGAVMALLLAMVLGKMKPDVSGALFSLCVILVLLAIAAFDLFVRWDDIDLQHSSRRSARYQRWSIRLLRFVWPEVVLVLGILVGHLLWTG
jgi:L-lactate permease